MLRQRIGHIHTGGLCPNVPGCNGAIVIFQESRLGIYIQTDVLFNVRCNVAIYISHKCYKGWGLGIYIQVGVVLMFLDVMSQPLVNA